MTEHTVISTDSNTADRPHAELGGSSSNIWSNCPGSYFYKKELPKQLPTKYTDEGTKAHNVAEVLLTQYLKIQVEGECDMSPEQIKIIEDADEAMLEAANGYVTAIWENLLEKQITGKFYGLEDKFMLSEQFDMWGYTDFWAAHVDDRAKRRGIIVDFKYGYQKVDIDKNAQLAFYAAAMQEEFTKQGKPLDYVTAVIYQPRADGEAYKETTFTASQLVTWKKKFLKAGEQIFIKRKPKFKVGSHCRWCQAQAVCKSYAKDVINSTEMAIVDTKLELPTPDKFDDATLSNIILNADKLEQFLDACKKYGISRFMQNSPIPGTKCVASKGRRKWKKEEDKIGEELIKIGVKDPFNRKLKGLGEIEKELKKNKVKADDIEYFMSQNCDKSVPSITIVSATDPRQAVTTIEDMVTEITES